MSHNAEVEKKIMNLTFSQCVMMNEYPHSLFVPSFLHETMMATKVKNYWLRQNLHHKIGNNA
jgi:hypothetical protein